MKSLVPLDCSRNETQKKKDIRNLVRTEPDTPDISLFTKRQVWKRQAIRKNESGKRAGRDFIDAVVLKSCRELVPVMTRFFNACLKQGIFPKEWKEGVLVPILMEGKDENLAKSQQPVCLLSILEKTFE